MQFDQMKRREFITLLGGAAAWPLAANAQPAAVAMIGVLVTGNPNPEPFLQGLREGLRAAGHVEGQNIRLELRSSEGKAALLPEKAAELVRLKPDVIVGFLTPTVQAAKEATKDIPIVMAPAGDPVGTGPVTSLARPGGNVTGVSTAGAEVAGKSLELIRELFPSARRVAVLANETDPFTQPFLAQIEQGAPRVDLEVEAVMSRPAAPQEPSFETMRAKRVDALIVQGTMMRKDVVDLANKYRLPSLGSNQTWPRAGGLMSYSANFPQMFREAASYVDKILKGRQPEDLPVALATKFDLVINLKTAKTLSLTIPESFLVRADEVIE